jgi:hypothetical protein
MFCVVALIHDGRVSLGRGACVIPNLSVIWVSFSVLLLTVVLGRELWRRAS